MVGVGSVADTIAKAAELGGTLLAGPMPVPGVGIYAVLADPTGAAFSIMQPDSDDSGPTPDPNDLGRVSWNELWSSEPEKAWAFYSELFGWVETGTMDMGPGGLYRMYGTTREGQSLGGFAQKMPEQPGMKSSRTPTRSRGDQWPASAMSTCQAGAAADAKFAAISRLPVSPMLCSSSRRRKTRGHPTPPPPPRRAAGSRAAHPRRAPPSARREGPGLPGENGRR